MGNPVSLQIGLFFSCLVFGFALGGVYVLLGLMRRKRKFWLSAVSDIIFWLLSAPAVFLFFMGLNGGDVRGYLLFAVFGGGFSVAVGWYFLVKKKKVKKEQKNRGESLQN